MTNRFLSRLIRFILGILVLVFSGCASTPPTRHFVLSSGSNFEKMGIREGERCFAIGIGPVKIPEYLNQPEIVTRITQNELRLDEFAKWAEPLEENIPQILAENLSSLLCIRSIAAFPRRGEAPDYRIEVRVLRMDGALGENVFLDVSWSIADGADRRKPPLVTKRSTYREPSGGKDYEAFVSAQSRNLAHVSREIAETILILSK